MAVATKGKITPKTYKTQFPVDWCPGCGDYGILNALQQALAKLQIPRHLVAVVGGIGCSGKAQYHVNAYGVHTLHGRPLTYATGIRLANPNMHVIVVSGDGDSMAIGAGHFVGAGRRNTNITHLMFNNEVYGLTKGQAGPTLPLGLRTKSLPEPNMNGAVNPLMMAMTVGYTWIGRGYAYDVRRLVDLIMQAIEHPGSSFLDILQPCPTYNDLHTQEWFSGKDLGRPRIYDLQKEGYDPVIPPGADEATVDAKLLKFIEKAHEWGDRIPTGVFLVNKNVSSYEERLQQRIPNYFEAPPAQRPIMDEKGVTLTDLSPIFDELAMD